MTGAVAPEDGSWPSGPLTLNQNSISLYSGNKTKLLIKKTDSGNKSLQRSCSLKYVKHFSFSLLKWNFSILIHLNLEFELFRSQNTSGLIQTEEPAELQLKHRSVTCQVSEVCAAVWCGAVRCGSAHPAGLLRSSPQPSAPLRTLHRSWRRLG